MNRWSFATDTILHCFKMQSYLPFIPTGIHVIRFPVQITLTFVN